MWNIIANISSIFTCLTFLLYLAGHIWVVFKSKHTIYEKFTVIPYNSNIAIEDEDNSLIVDDNGCEFILESEYGINNVNIYKVDYNISNKGTLCLNSKTLKSTSSNLKTEKLFIRCDLGETIPTTQFEIKRADYAVITFDICESGKNGHIIVCNYKYKMNLKSFLYHLCV